MSFLYVTAAIFSDNSVKYTSVDTSIDTAIGFYNSELAANFATVRTLTTYTLAAWGSVYMIEYDNMTVDQQTGLNIYAPNVVKYGVFSMLNTVKNNDNVIIGSDSGTSVLDTVGNVVIGVRAGQSVDNLGPITAVGYQAGQISTRPNTIVGYNAGIALTTGSSNVCIGNGVASSLSTGSSNVLVGEGVANDYTGSNTVCIGSAITKCGTTSKSNVVIGCSTAGFSLTSGSTNVFVGFGAGSSTTTGSNSIAIGASARCGSTSSGNVSIGRSAATNLTIGATNVFVGDQAGLGCTTGSNSVCIGAGSKCGTTSTGSNVIIGQGAGSTLTTGNGNIFIGRSAGSVISSTSDNILIGNVGAGDSGTVKIGTAGTHTTCHIAGISGITAPSSVGVFIAADGQLGTILSSKKYKKNIQNISRVTVNELNYIDVKSFHYLDEADTDPLSYGMIAEEMHNINTNLVQYDEFGEPKTIKYHLLVPLLLAYVQQLRKEIEIIKDNNKY